MSMESKLLAVLAAGTAVVRLITACVDLLAVRRGRRKAGITGE
jgi:hypothetical protein